MLVKIAIHGQRLLFNLQHRASEGRLADDFRLQVYGSIPLETA